MKIDKAIANLTAGREDCGMIPSDEYTQTIDQAVEALKRIRSGRSPERLKRGLMRFIRYMCCLLPGETNEEKQEMESTLLAGWPCCACDEMIRDDPDASVVLLDKLATWEDPSWGNVLEGSGGRASASLCGRCTTEERPPQYAIRNEGEAHIRVPLDEMEDLEGERA